MQNLGQLKWKGQNLNTNKTQIEFTDRYGGNPPSWLRGCFDQCEATGYVPIFKPLVLMSEQERKNNLGIRGDEKYLLDWIAAEKENPSKDNWHFLKCHSCHGTGRVSWFKTFLRIPKWILKGIHFIIYGPNMNGKLSWKDIVLKFKCAFLVDLGLWRP